MGAFGEGLLFGMVVQVAIGPVCLGVLQKAMRDRLRHALWMVLGVATADGLYIALAALGAAALLAAGPLQAVVGLAGAAALAYFGLRNILADPNGSARSPGSGGAWPSARYGFLLTLTNPLTVLFWGGIFAGLGAGAWLGSTGALYAFAAGCIASTLLFLTGVVLLGRWLGRVMEKRAVLHWLNRGVGFFLLLFAVRLAAGVLG